MLEAPRLLLLILKTKLTSPTSVLKPLNKNLSTAVVNMSLRKARKMLLLATKGDKRKR
jgi:hypothetical protein